MYKIAIDIMGGDNAPNQPIKGIKSFIKSKEYKDTYFYIVGDKESAIKEINEEIPQNLYTIIHTKEKITMNDQPSRIMKSKPNSSMLKCLRLLSNNKVQSVISAGNTGALMLCSSIIIKRIPGIKKVILAPKIPNKYEHFILADVGANIDLKPYYFLDIAKLCSIYYKILNNNKIPDIHLLNIGTEKNKGPSSLIEIYKLLKSNLHNFKGNVEARDLMTKKLNIVLCDGFIGNIVLKLTEGLSNYLLNILKKVNHTEKLDKEIELLRKLFNFETSTLLLGINGIVLKCHGSSSEQSFKNAIIDSIKLNEFKLIDKIHSSFNEKVNT